MSKIALVSFVSALFLVVGCADVEDAPTEATGSEGARLEVETAPAFERKPLEDACAALAHSASRCGVEIEHPKCVAGLRARRASKLFEATRCAQAECADMRGCLVDVVGE